MNGGPSRVARAVLLVASSCCFLFACDAGGRRDPVWVDLARGFEPRPLADAAREWEHALGDGRRTRIQEDGGDVWVEATLGAEDWEPAGEGLWSMPRPTGGGFAYVGIGQAQLAVDGVELSPVGPRERPKPGRCYLDEKVIGVAVEPEEPAPAATTFRVSPRRGYEQDGVWRVQTRGRAGAGIPVYSGQREEVVCAIPPASRLSFVATFSTPDPEAAPSFRIRLDDDVLWERVDAPGEAWYAVPLPAEGSAEARLSFEVDGPPGLGVFFAPSIGPVEVGTHGARPWEDRRPNLVMFIADTFRADSLAVYGGDPSRTPNLNRLAERSLRFLEARSTATWTLPSISSILTGLFPAQHGAKHQTLSVSRNLTTITEALARDGYRTCAVTDSGFFAEIFGLDQGFEWFVEFDNTEWNLTETVEQALACLDRDDGRPVFLVVHTYRAHGPFRQGPEESTEAWDQFIADGHAYRLEKLGAGQTTREQKVDLVLAFIDRYRDLYFDGVRDLDAKFGRFWQGVRERAALRPGYLVFLGDHGEALGENDTIAHGGKLWDTRLRVPLLLHGHDIEPGDSRIPVTHVDVAPTLARLAGLGSEPGWVGASLLDLPADRPIFSFRLEEEVDEVAIQEGRRKVLAPSDVEALLRGEVVEAYDLELDPGELEDLAGDATWPADLARRTADAISVFLQSRADSERVQADPELLRRLAEMGYVGE